MVVIIFVAIIGFIIYLNYDKIKTFSEKAEYSEELEKKYAHFSKQQLKEIYADLEKLEKSHINYKNVNQKAKNTRGDAQLDYLLNAIAMGEQHSQLRESVGKKWGITFEHLDWDIAYLATQINQ